MPISLILVCSLLLCHLYSCLVERDRRSFHQDIMKRQPTSMSSCEERPRTTTGSQEERSSSILSSSRFWELGFSFTWQEEICQLRPQSCHHPIETMRKSATVSPWQLNEIQQPLLEDHVTSLDLHPILLSQISRWRWIRLLVHLLILKNFRQQEMTSLRLKRQGSTRRPKANK